jgi:hypothetical protein
MTSQREIQGEGYTHIYLWNCAKTLLNQPETKSHQDFYFVMAAMLMMYLTYEAYLNFVGIRLDPETWKNEREFFSKDPFRGMEGKLKRISEKLRIEIDKGQRPYQSIKALERLRNYLAHGKPEMYAFVTDLKDGEEPDMFPLQIYDLVTREKAERALKDTEEFIEYLHSLAGKQIDDIAFKVRALSLPLASASGGPKGD